VKTKYMIKPINKVKAITIPVPQLILKATVEELSDVFKCSKLLFLVFYTIVTPNLLFHKKYI
jgi:hypothetical protein